MMHLKTLSFAMCIILNISANNAQDAPDIDTKCLEKLVKEVQSNLFQMVVTAVEENDERADEIFEKAFNFIKLSNEFLSKIESRQRLIELSNQLLSKTENNKNEL